LATLKTYTYIIVIITLAASSIFRCQHRFQTRKPS